jgi:class 3 adenylate cyclase
MIFKAVAMGWDALNLGLFSGRFPFISPQTYFLASVLLFMSLELKETKSELIFRSKLASIRDEVLAELVFAHIESASVLDKLAYRLSSLTLAERVSLGEVLLSSETRFLGTSGSYEKPEVTQPMADSSVSFAAVKSKSIQIGTLPRTGKCIEGESAQSTEYLVVPLLHGEDLPGLLCMTDFRKGVVPPFVLARTHTLQKECEILFHLVRSKRDNQAKARLVQMTRLKVHAMQIESESYFLERFVLSDTIAEPAFIYGDVVDSVTLNEIFSGDRLKQVVDAHLRVLFERTRHLGVILTRDRGDTVSVIVPNQRSDVGTGGACTRAFEVVEVILSLRAEFTSIAKRHGITMPVQYRFVMSVGTISLVEGSRPGGLTPFSLLSAPAIDEAARVLSSVALPGECLVVHAACERVENVSGKVIRLPPSRFKGKSADSILYSVLQQANSKQAKAV